MDNTQIISGGAFQIARKIFQGELWNDKPASWTKVWLYILGKVAHKDQGKLKRGVGYFNFSDERTRIGKDITPDMIKKCIRYFKKSQMIGTTKSTRGMYIEVLNYNTYQVLENYKAPQKAQSKHYRSTTEAPLYNKNEKNENNEKKKYSAEGAGVLKLFEEIDPKNKTYYGNTTQRLSADFLLKEYGLEKIREVLDIIRGARGSKGFPSITSPYEMKEKWTKVGEALMRQREELKPKQYSIIL